MRTASMAIDRDEEPISVFLLWPEEGGWRRGVWCRTGYCDGVWLPQGWRLSIDCTVELNGRVALKLNQQGVPVIVKLGHAEDLPTLPAFESVTWIAEPATAAALLKALAGRRFRATVLV